MKKLFLLLGIICFTFSARAFAPCATAVTENDTDRYIYCPLPSGDTAVYYIISDSTVAAGSPTTHYFLNHKNIREKNVVIPETMEHRGKTYRVTKLMGGAFIQDTIKSVVLPKSVEEIGANAFYWSTIENISPLYCKKIGDYSFHDCLYLKNVDMSRCTFDTIPISAFHKNFALQWVKLPITLVCADDGAHRINFEYQMRSLKFLILPSNVKSYSTCCQNYSDPRSFPLIFLSEVPPFRPFTGKYRQGRAVWFPCGYDSAYLNSNWGNGVYYDSVRPCHFLNLDSGYMDLDSVCPWEVERKYGFHPDTVGVYIVEKHNPYDCDSFNIYFVKSFLDPGVVYDTTINIEPDKEDTTVLWTWEGTGYAYNVYRDGDYITTVEQPSYLDTNIEFNVQYCYNFAPVNEKYCEGKWSTTNCYTMLGVGVQEAEDASCWVLHPNPVKETLLITAVGAGNASAFKGKTAGTGSETAATATHFDGSPYEITDITGRIVLQGQYNATEGIHVGGLAKGIYLLRMEGKVEKFVKE